MINKEAYYKYCNEHVCSNCPYRRDDNECLAEWAYHDAIDEFVDRISKLIAYSYTPMDYSGIAKIAEELKEEKK